MPEVIPIVIRKNGDKFVPRFPVNLYSGDEIILVEQTKGVIVPKGRSWTIEKMTEVGPAVAEAGPSK